MSASSRHFPPVPDSISIKRFLRLYFIYSILSISLIGAIFIYKMFPPIIAIHMIFYSLIRNTPMILILFIYRNPHIHTNTVFSFFFMWGRIGIKWVRDGTHKFGPGPNWYGSEFVGSKLPDTHETRFLSSLSLLPFIPSARSVVCFLFSSSVFLPSLSPSLLLCIMPVISGLGKWPLHLMSVRICGSLAN